MPAPIDVLLLTGPPAVGKTTVARLLADRLERSTMVDVDVVRAMVRRGHVAAWYPGERIAQHRLGVRNACQLTRNFVEAGYTVVIADLLTVEKLPRYCAGLAGLAMRLIQLLPTLKFGSRLSRREGMSLRGATRAGRDRPARRAGGR